MAGRLAAEFNCRRYRLPWLPATGDNATMEAEPLNRNRRRFQFRLRAPMLAMAISARLVLVLTTVLALPAKTAMAIIRRPDREDAQYIALAERFPAVCLVCEDGTAVASGTLIASRWVLTAGHVVDPWNLTTTGEWVQSSTRSPKRTVLFGTREYHVKEVVEYPGYSCKDGGTDLALLKLDTQVDSVVPLSIYVGDRELGELVTLVGFGATGTFETGPPQDAEARAFQAIPARNRVKRAGTNVVDSTTDKFLITCAHALNSATDLEASIAGGDSGGAALIEVDGRVLLAGVLALAVVGNPPEHPPALYGAHSRCVRVSRVARWIEDTTGEDFGVVKYGQIAVRAALVLIAILAASLTGMRFMALRKKFRRP
jgi:hypothetical protein